MLLSKQALKSWKESAGERTEQHGGTNDAKRPLERVAGNADGRLQTTAANDGAEEKVAHDHEKLTCEAAGKAGKQRLFEGRGAAIQETEDQLGRQYDDKANEKGRNGVYGVAAEQIGQIAVSFEYS